jgi:hypothetical protein
MDRDDNRPQNEQEFDDSMLEDSQYQAESDPNEWQDQPIDDFADEAPAAEPMEGEEPADEFQQLSEEEGGEPAAESYSDRKTGGKGSPSAVGRYLPLLVGVVAIGGIGFLGWQQMSGMLNQQQASENSGTAFTPPEQQMAEAGNTLPPPLPPSEMPSVGEAQPMLQPMPMPGEMTVQNEMPSEPTMQPPQMVDTPMPTMPTPVAPTTTVISAPVAEDPRVAQLASEVEMLRANESKLNEHISTLQAAAIPSPDTSAAQSKIRSLEDKVAMLEQQLSSRSARAASSSSSSSSSSTASSSEEASEATPRKSREFKRAHSGKAGGRASDNDAARLQREVNDRLRGGSAKVTPSSTGPAVMQARAPAPMPSAPMQAIQAWTLRSAQPGSAWLSLGGSNNLRRVAPGDKIQGLGTIVAIRQIAGKWVVEGTQGSVR